MAALVGETIFCWKWALNNLWITVTLNTSLEIWKFYTLFQSAAIVCVTNVNCTVLLKVSHAHLRT